MQKITLPVIFLIAVAAALYYVSTEEHGAGTLIFLAAVLLVGQVCVTLPFIYEAKKKSAGTPPAAEDLQKKALANHQVIHEDLRSLGETLIKRLNAIAERQNELEKKIREAADAAEIDSDLEELFSKIDHATEERLNALREELESAAANSARETIAETLPGKDDFARHFENTEERLDEILCAVENLADEKSDDETDEFFDENVPENAEENFADDGELEDFPESEDDVPADENFAESAPENVSATQEEAELPLDVPASAPRAKLVLDAMFGIGNKPFLRGNAPGLSPERGVPMNFVEIGKWSFDFAPSSEEISVRIHLNDAAESLGETITLAPGQTLEIGYTPEK